MLMRCPQQIFSDRALQRDRCPEWVVKDESKFASIWIHAAACRVANHCSSMQIVQLMHNAVGTLTSYGTQHRTIVLYKLTVQNGAWPEIRATNIHRCAEQRCSSLEAQKCLPQGPQNDSARTALKPEDLAKL